MWGQQLILDMEDCDREAIRSAETIRTFCRELVAGIGMKPHGEPILEHFAAHTPKAAGYTLVQLIETSSICGHFAERAGDAYLDIFSCKPFSEEVAIAICRKVFSPAPSSERA